MGKKIRDYVKGRKQGGKRAKSSINIRRKTITVRRNEGDRKY